MSKISRYVLKEILVVFLVALTGFTALIVLVLLADEARKQGLGPGPIVRLLPFILPQAMPFAIPATILFAACSVYGRMSAANEITAIKSLGISPMAVLWPIFILSFLISVAAVWLNDVAASWGRTGAQKVIMQSIEQIVYGMLRTHRSYSTGKLAINVKEVDGQRLIKMTVTIQNEGGQATTLTADEAELRSRPERNTLNLIMMNASFEIGDEFRGFIPGRSEREIPLIDVSRVGGGGASSPVMLPIRQIPQESIDQRRAIAQTEESLAAEAAFQLITGDFSSLRDVDWQNRQAGLAQSRVRLNRLQIEPWRRWANGFCCFFFVFVGAPLAIHLRTADLWTTFGICFLPILISFYPLMAYGVDRAKAGVLPPYSVWLGNVALLLIGCWILRKVLRY